jgi:hypothetical protein
MAPMNPYTLETGEYIYRLVCECCGTAKRRVWGFVSKNGDAHAVYYALLNVIEERPRIGLTLSVGPWWEGTEPSQRSWVHLEVWPEEDGAHMRICEPEKSNFYPWEKGGKPMNREVAKQSDVIEEIWAVADFVVAEDPAVSSYLESQTVDVVGRQERDGDNPVHYC